MSLNLLALYFLPFIPDSKRFSTLLRLPFVSAVLLGISLNSYAQAEKYANISSFPDAEILTFLQKAYPNDKLNYYDVKLNGRMQHVKNYYDYISFRCVLLDSQLVKTAPPAAVPVSPADSVRAAGGADTALMRRILEDTTGRLRDSVYRRAAADSMRKAAEDSSKKAAADKPDTSLGLQASTSNQLASVLSGSNDISLSNDNVLTKRQVDSSWVLADTLISARRGVTHPAETSLSTVSKTEKPVAASYTITADTVYMINCGANAEHRPSLIWIYHSKDPSTHIVVGAGDFKEEMLMLQSFCDGLGVKLSPFQVEIWDLFVKSHQSAMYTPVYDHEAHYKSPVPAAGDTTVPVIGN